MRIKTIILVKRKPGLSDQQFCERYDGHIQLALKHFGHLWHEYRRNYLTQSMSLASSWPPQLDENPPYDAVSELIYKDATALEEMQRIASDPEVTKVLVEDEERTFDRSATRLVMCEVVETKIDDGRH